MVQNSLFPIRCLMIFVFTFLLVLNFEWPSPNRRVRPTVWSSETFLYGQLPCLPRSEKQFSPTIRNSPNNPYMMMAAAHVAYRLWPGKQTRILKSWGFSNIQTFKQESTNTNGYSAEHDNFYLIAFRGTQEPHDLFTDFSVELSPSEWNPSSQARVHRGFNQAASSVKQIVIKTAQDALQKNKPLFLVGHSLGGAIALLSSEMLLKNKLPFDSVWTFGAPMLGNKPLIQILEHDLGSRWQRFDHADDPIPALPLTKRDENSARQWANSYGNFLPILNSLSQNADYHDSSIVGPDSKTLSRRSISQRTWKEIARGFIEHLPRSYVCNLSGKELRLEN